MAEVFTETVTEPRYDIVIRGLKLDEIRALKSVLDYDEDEECECDGPCSCSLGVVVTLRKKLNDILTGHHTRKMTIPRA